MRVLFAGAGFLGRAAIARLRRDGHAVAAWVRSPDRARAALGPDVELVPIDAGLAALTAAVSAADGVVNLAGEPLVGRRWTAVRRRALEDSRVRLTADLVRAIDVAATKPRVLVSASAVGWYGDRGDERLTEASAPGDDYLAQLCRRWEDAAVVARRSGVRVVLSRTGVVLGTGGGALAPMLLPFRLGLGGPIGSGRQYFPWIHLDDFTAMVAAALSDDRYEGPINAVAPQEATSREFTAALGRALHRPAVLPAPAFALRAIFGEAATVLLASQRAVPRALLDRGFPFAFPNLDRALGSIFREHLSRWLMADG
jgi:uncharacterized protein (TIGR01777 family)